MLGKKQHRLLISLYGNHYWFFWQELIFLIHHFFFIYLGYNCHKRDPIIMGCFFIVQIVYNLSVKFVCRTEKKIGVWYVSWKTVFPFKESRKEDVSIRFSRENLFHYVLHNTTAICPNSFISKGPVKGFLVDQGMKERSNWRVPHRNQPLWDDQRKD